MAVRRIITLTTDFGLRDAYVAVMKGVILQLCPDAQIVDISHDIEPQNVNQGAFVLASAWRYFPRDSIHVAIVDPGVGTDRQAVAVQTLHGSFIGPDNGILFPSLVAHDDVVDPDGNIHIHAVVLENERYHLTPVSRTFHGRDIFAPAAAHLLLGTPLSEFGPQLERLATSSLSSPERHLDTLRGSVVYIDGYGNAITNIRRADMPASPRIIAGDAILYGLAPDYQSDYLVALIGSSGFIEIAARNGSAAKELNLHVGDRIVVRGGP